MNFIFCSGSLKKDRIEAVLILGFPESPALLPGVEQGLKCTADRAFVVEFKLSKLMQALVVVLDQPVARTDLQRAHKRNVARSLAGKRLSAIGFRRSVDRRFDGNNSWYRLIASAGGTKCENPGRSPG